MDLAAPHRSTLLSRRVLALISAAMIAALTMAIAAPAQATPSVAKAWGFNGDGELGNGTKTESAVPVAVSKLSGVKAVSAGNRHGLALLENGTVMAWGANGQGQLGDGTTTKSAVPVAVSGLKEVTAIAAGGDYSLALLKGGTVKAWGTNEAGELGNGTETNSTVPVAVSGLSEVTAISAPGSGDFSLALLKDGTVKAWGINQFGQLGDGSTGGSSLVPVAVSGLSEVTAISAGGAHGLALLKDGTVKAWGYNVAGQLGNGSTKDSNLPVAVKALTAVKAIAAGGNHGLALLENGTLMAWGDNERGALGDGTFTGPETCGEVPPFGCSKTPVAVSGLSEVTAISGGGNYSLAVLKDRTVKAWGANGSGQLGDGTSKGPEPCGPESCSTKPVAVCAPGSEVPCPSGPFLHNVAAIATGTGFSLAVVGPPPAGPAEYGQCVAKKKGEYTNSTCTTKSAKANKGKFEWYPGRAPTCVKVKKNKGKYSEAKCETRAEKKGKPRGEYEKEGGAGYTSTTGEATLATSLGVTVKCTTGTDLGEVTGPKTDVDTITFTGCEASGGKCTSLAGAKAEGEIVTAALETELIEPAPGEVWTEYANTAGAHAPYVAVFGCAGVGYFRIKGWVSGVTTGNINTMSSTSQTVFGASVGEQALETEFSTSPTFTEPSGPFATTETTTVHNTSASKTEIRT
jgi:alpha-tubulin suppressor-like RCC1 family protein